MCHRLHVPHQRHVEHAIGAGGDHVLDAVGRDHAGCWRADQIADILAQLVAAVGEAGNQFEIRMLDHLARGCSADQPGCPLRNPQCHLLLTLPRLAYAGGGDAWPSPSGKAARE